LIKKKIQKQERHIDFLNLRQKENTLCVFKGKNHKRT
jgi:hypothetical protein